MKYLLLIGHLTLGTFTPVLAVPFEDFEMCVATRNHPAVMESYKGMALVCVEVRK